MKPRDAAQNATKPPRYHRTNLSPQNSPAAPPAARKGPKGMGSFRPRCRRRARSRREPHPGRRQRNTDSSTTFQPRNAPSMAPSFISPPPIPPPLARMMTRNTPHRPRYRGATRPRIRGRWPDWQGPCQNAGKRDDVGNDLVLQIYRRQGNKPSQQGSGHDGVERGTERQDGGGEQRGRDGLHDRIAVGDRHRAGPAAPAEGQEREDREVVVPGDHHAASRAGRAGIPEAATRRHARDHDIEEAADHEARRRRRRCACGHTRSGHASRRKTTPRRPGEAAGESVRYEL